MLKITNKEIDKRLAERTIVRVDDYIGSAKHIRWKCKICAHVWLGTPANVVSLGSNCPACAKHLMLTNERVDTKIQTLSLKFKRVGKVKTYTDHVEVICTTCGYMWSLRPQNIRPETKCRNCTKKTPVTNEKIDIGIQARPIRRVEDSQGSARKILWECLTCLNTWKAAPNDIMNNSTGCPKCVHVISMPEELWLNECNVPDTPINRQVSLFVNGCLIKVDGYVSETNTVYEFYGDYWHGNPQVYDPSDINRKVGKTFGELFETTQHKRSILLQAGYKLVEVWGSDWTTAYNYRKFKRDRVMRHLQ